MKDLEKNKSISIDESKKFQDEIQKSTDSSISKIDENSKLKENEIFKSLGFGKSIKASIFYNGW